MQNQNWRLFSKVIAVTAVAVLIVSFTTLAVAQRISGEDRNAIFAGASRVPTKVNGVTAFAAPPKGFNPLTATNRELLSYGLPQAPDKSADAKGYEQWQRAMLALKTTVNNVKAKPYTSREMVPTPGVAAASNADGTISVGSYNWSGIGNFNTLKKWNAKTSFDEVVSIWNVPVSNHPFGNLPCSWGPWFEVTWNGIDGYGSGDVVQGGSADYWDDGGCGGPVEYFGWVEWYPSYSVLELFCGDNPCPVSPGDDFEVVSYGEPGTAEQFVFVEDISQQWGGTFGMTYVTGPGVVGNTAEYIVERPCCNGGNFYPLANYIYEFFNYSFAYDVAGTLFYPGNTGTHTAIFTMYADDGETPISYPFMYGTAGNQGRYSIFMSDENCAYSGGCTP